MPEFDVTLTLTVKADDNEQARGIGANAAIHLLDTFNDDESICPLVQVESKPCPE